MPTPSMPLVPLVPHPEIDPHSRKLASDLPSTYPSSDKQLAALVKLADAFATQAPMYLLPKVKVSFDKAAPAMRVPTASPTTCDTVAINSGQCRRRIEMQAHDMDTATVPPNGSIPQNNLVANLARDSAALPFPTTATQIPNVRTEYSPHITNVFIGTATLRSSVLSSAIIFRMEPLTKMILQL
jgi:hypothetical protein